jgi:hypothetical protein
MRPIRRFYTVFATAMPLRNLFLTTPLLSPIISPSLVVKLIFSARSIDDPHAGIKIDVSVMIRCASKGSFARSMQLEPFLVRMVCFKPSNLPGSYCIRVNVIREL